jgi:hypothetical protein
LSVPAPTTENASVSERKPGDRPTIDDETLARFEAVRERARRAVEAAHHARDRSNAASRVQGLVSDLEHTVNELDGLRTAMRTRATIEQAKGVVMALNGCSEDDAFATLVRLSQASQRKLHDVAALVVRDVGQGEAGRQAVIELIQRSVRTSS